MKIRKRFFDLITGVAVSVMITGAAAGRVVSAESVSDSSVPAEAESVTPGESFYGYVLQDYFSTFDKGPEGSYVEPGYGELISPDPDEDFYYMGFDIGEEQLAAETEEALKSLYDGKADMEKGSAGQRLYDLYDSLVHEKDDRTGDEELFISYVRPLAEAKDPEAFLKAVLDLYRETGVNVLFDITAEQDGDTNVTYPCVSLCAPKAGAKVAFDPEIPGEIVTGYQEALGDFMTALGYSFSKENVEEAFRLQDVIAHGEGLLFEMNQVRRMRVNTPSEKYTADDRSDDYDRLEALHPQWTMEEPEGLSDTEQAVFSNKDYAGLLSHISYKCEELTDLNPSLPFLDFLAQAGFESGKVIVEPDDREVLENIQLSEDNLNAFKINAIVCFAEKTGFTPFAASDAMDRMNRAALCAMWGNENALEEGGTADVEEALWDTVFTLLPQDKALLWAEKYYDESLTPRVTKMIERLIDAYKVRIGKNEWLQDSEKETIIEKLENMISVVGIPTEETYVFPVITSRAEGGTLLTNRIALCQAEQEKTLRLVNEKDFYRKVFDQEIAYGDWHFDALALNAVNNYAFNTLIIPASTIEVVLDSGDDDDMILCKLGIIVGHEISHAFDATGSLHDKIGALVCWWSEESRNYFHELEAEFDAYYQNFDIIKGLTNNFDGNVQECFADFAGMTIVLDIIGGDEELTKQFFEEMPQGLFMSVISRATAEQYVEEALDSHPMGASRVNALISSADQFYELYDVKEGDPMYTAPEERLYLW